MLQSKAANPGLFIARIAPWFPVALLLFALVYYSSYAFCGLDLNGEGGTIAVIADRIRHGYRPFVDTFLGYNLLWFYPIVWLFRIFGPNFGVPIRHHGALGLSYRLTSNPPASPQSAGRSDPDPDTRDTVPELSPVFWGSRSDGDPGSICSAAAEPASATNMDLGRCPARNGHVPGTDRPGPLFCRRTDRRGSGIFRPRN